MDISKIVKLVNQGSNSGVKLVGLGVEELNGKVYLFYKTDEDGSKYVRVARSEDGIDFEMIKKWSERYRREGIDKGVVAKIKPRKKYFDDNKIEIEKIIKIDSGRLVIYHHWDKWRNYQVGAALLDQKTNKIIWRSNKPMWESSSGWNDKKIEWLGTVYIRGQIIGYWLVDQKTFYGVVYPSFKLRDDKARENIYLSLDKASNNPIISPKSNNSWEAFNTFNPAAVYVGGKVHILYRAQGFDYVSVVGHAVSSDGINIEKRDEWPIYYPKEKFEWAENDGDKVNWDFAGSGGGYGGIEDPRVTRIGDRIYMLYVAFNGISEPRIAMTSIAVDDFLNQRWLWERAVLISPPGIVDKGPAIFPEKINGKYVIMHRVFPNILIDYVDELNFDGSTWLEGKYSIKIRPSMWDSRKIGAGAPPIKTKDGWLLIYYATCDQENARRYLIGAMLLDLKDPTKVLYRSKNPILVPSERYENEGFKAGVVYPCGGVVIGETLFVYYGGADSYVCVATANLEQFLGKLKYNEEPTMEVAKLKKLP